MRFETPLALVALLLVPLALLGYVAIERRRARYAVHYTNIEVLAGVVAAARTGACGCRRRSPRSR